MSKVAVIAHAGKTFGGGLLELRAELARQGVEDPLWREVPKSKAAPAEVRNAIDSGAELIFAWGGDGMVQRCIDVIAGTDTALAIVPAGTANLLATNLDIPQDIEQAVAIGLRGERRKLDVGRFNGERFGVMAGAGFDASMIQQADGGLKDRFGRVAYVWAGSKSLRAKPFKAKIAIDGTSWYSGNASCILVGNVGRLFGGIEVFENARPDDGRLE
ncbi:MAG TPA: diacylglycerol kinase family protein, partial [Gaiellaceae bacterium]|nr:diacylglycerol kinase family protein [Gaiellaceae bacterium]